MAWTSRSNSFLISSLFFLFPVHKKHWTTNLHTMQPMGHIQICLPSSQSSLLTSLLNCSQSASHLMLLSILVAFSWSFSNSMLFFFFFDVAETHAVFKTHHRLTQLYHEAPLYCSTFLSYYFLISDVLFTYYCKLS